MAICINKAFRYTFFSGGGAFVYTKESAASSFFDSFSS